MLSASPIKQRVRQQSQPRNHLPTLTTQQPATSAKQSKYASLNNHHMAQIDGIPVTYILEKLHQLGARYFGDKSTAFAELHVEGIDKPFWVHEEYLVLQSLFFREVFENVSSGDVITIKLPSPETFEPLLEFLYSGDADKWYDTLTVENYHDVWQNIEFLGLGPAAQTVCLAFYQHEVEEDEDEDMSEDGNMSEESE